jgi:predicted Rossmann-fold nucleotide-binding protein
MERVPFLLFGRDFWNRIINWEALADAGTISTADLDLFVMVDTAAEAIAAMNDWDGAGSKRRTIPGR